jgi:ABC-2 type transport system permease protein
MSPINSTHGESLRITWTIAIKDILDAIRNKTTLSVVLSATFLVVFYRFLPALESGDVPPRLVIFDPGNFSMMAALEDRPDFDLIETESQQAMEAYLGNRDSATLGLVIPADLDQRLSGQESLELDGYVIHWASDATVTEIKAFFERQLTELLGVPIQLNSAGNTVYTQRDSRGYAFLTSAGMVVVILLIGVSIAPHLMIEEKQTRTMDALLVSPVSSGQMVMGKAIAGLFYCLVASAVVFAFNASLITQWGIAILAAVSGSLFAVALGLLMGSVLKVRQQMTVWTWFLFAPLIIPIFLVIATDLLPAGFIAAIQWIPTVALAEVFRVSFSNMGGLTHYGPSLALVAASAAVILTAVGWVVRRSDLS